jgi:hypothetical protein
MRLPLPPRRDDDMSALEVVGYILISTLLLIFLINLATGWPG